MRDRSLPLMLSALLMVGCSRPEAPPLQPGDVVRPELAFAPDSPWPADAKVAVGMLVRVERAGSESRYLYDKEINLEQVVMAGRVTFFNGEQVMGEPHELPFVHDC
jgi:hypothetical protein